MYLCVGETDVAKRTLFTQRVLGSTYCRSQLHETLVPVASSRFGDEDIGESP